MKIKRIDSYTDGRFSKRVLNQHGAYLVFDTPYEVEIISSTEAVIRGNNPDFYKALIEEFRFHAPHIVLFYDKTGKIVEEYPQPNLIEIELDSIQPSQFFVDEEKLEAVQTFIHKPEDIVIQVIPWKTRYISLDGHTRLYLAEQSGFNFVKAVICDTEDWVWRFVREAEQRNILCPRDMVLLPHERYVIEWNQYCEDIFGE